MSKFEIILLAIVAWFVIVAITGYLWGFFTSLGRNDRLHKSLSQRDDNA